MKKISIILLSILCPSSLFAQETLSLQQCREMALQYNKEMAASVKQTESALYTMKSYKGNFFPNFTANGMGLYSTADGGFGIEGGKMPVILYDAAGNLVPTGIYTHFPGINLDYKVGTVYMGGIRVEQPLYMGGKIRAAYRMSVLGKEMAEMNEALTATEVILKTDKAYALVVKAQEMKKVADKYNAVLRELLSNVESAYKHGLKPQNDVLLKLTMGGTEVADQSVKVDASSAEQATITLANLIPGEAEVKIEAKMVKTGESYALEGSNTNDLRTVSAKGTVEAGVLTLDATLKITAPIAGTWKLAEIAKDESETFVSGPVSMVWEAAEGTMLGFLPVTSIPNIAEGFGSIALVQVLQSVTFQEDGQIVASISKAGVDLSKPVTPVWETSEPGYASYNVTDKQILVFLDITKIMGSLKSKAAIDPLEQIMALLQNGIPVNYEIAPDGKSARVYIDKALVSQIAPLLPTLAELIGDDALNGMGQLVKSILKAFPEAMEKTTKFEVGLKLIK